MDTYWGFESGKADTDRKNTLFESMVNKFLTATEVRENPIYKSALQDKNQFILHGQLNMELILEKFVVHFHELYGEQPVSFLEEDGRRYFLLYLKPIINGVGNSYIETQIRNMERKFI